MSDKTASSGAPFGFTERLQKVTRTLSEEFYTRSPSTQFHIKDMTGGITPTSNSNRRTTITRGPNGTVEKAVEIDVETNEERFNVASDFEKEMMFRHGLIQPNCKAYREYALKYAKTT